MRKVAGLNYRRMGGASVVALGVAGTFFGSSWLNAKSVDTNANRGHGVVRQPKLWQQGEVVSNQQAVGNGLETWRSVIMPSREVVRKLVEVPGLGTSKLSSEQERVNRWFERARKEAQTGPSPRAKKRVLDREKQLLSGEAAVRGTHAELIDDEFRSTPEKNILGILVEFEPPGGLDSFSRSVPVDRDDPSLGCTTVESSYPSLHFNEDGPPGPRDNHTFFKSGISVDDYRSAIFGTGPEAGYGVVRDDLGGVDLQGISLNNYLLEMSGGTYTMGGDILDEPVQVPRAAEYYGHALYQEDENGECVAPVFSDAHYIDLVLDTISALTEANDGQLDFSQFDADGDNVIDLLVLIVAGYGFQNGGGEDRFIISSSSFFEPRQVSGFQTPDDASDDYFVSGFNLDPEQLTVGAIQEEFEHQFGLPDLYSTDTDNSNGWWAAHSSGVWGGPLGGTRPVGHNLWQDWVLGWRSPLVLDYDDPRLLGGKLSLELGRARNTPEGVEDGVIIRLPDKEKVTPNLAGTGIGWYSGSADLLDNRVTREFDLTSSGSQLRLSFDASWDIELDWDYGLVEFSTDSGATWSTLQSEGEQLSDQDPNGVGVVVPGEGWGLTGAGTSSIGFDISEFAGQVLSVRLRYLTDPAVSNPGWQVDNLLLEDEAGVLYANDLETDFSDWTNGGWLTTPFVEVSPHYYLAEWRDNSGFDASLDAISTTFYARPDEPPPEHIAYSNPSNTSSLILAYRDTSEGFDQSINDTRFEGNSIGPKFGHLVIDSHPDPARFDTPDPTVLEWVGVPFPNRIQPANAGFGLAPTPQWQAGLGYDYETDTFLEKKKWPSEPGVSTFHDSFGYTPGIIVSPDFDLFFAHAGAGAVLPSKGPYSTKVSGVDGLPFEALYGQQVAGFELGSGHPGDAGVHYGLHLAVTRESKSSATVSIWNDPFEVELNTRITRGANAPLARQLHLELTQNIGGKLVSPVVVFELPEQLQYVPGSATGGLAEVGSEGFESAAQVALALIGDPSKLQMGPSAVAPRYLVWTGAEIGTGQGLPEFGLSYVSQGSGSTPAQVNVELFHRENESFQRQAVTLP